jgi:ATPase family associated with various cellular activities (AAA)
MSERLLLDRSAVRPAPSAALTALAGGLARRLADVLVAHGSTESGAAEAAGFLSSWAETAAAHTNGFTRAPITLQRLAERHGVSPIERDLVVLAGLAEEHQGIAATLRTLHPTGEPHPTLGLATLVLGDSDENRDQLRALVAEGPAFRAGLLRTGGTGPLFERSLLLPEALWLALHGHDAWPDSLPRRPIGPTPAGLAGWLAERPATRAVRALVNLDATVLLVSSDDPAVGLARCAALAEAAGRPAVAAVVDIADPGELRLLSLHATVRGAVPVAITDRLFGMAGPSAAVPIAASGLTGPLLVCAPFGAVQPAADRPVITLPAGPVSLDDQRAAWQGVVPELSPEASDALAARHRLDPAVTAQLGLDLRGEPAPTVAEVSALVRSRLAVTLPAGVELVTSDIEWDGIVLSAEGMAQLTQAVGRLDHQRLVLESWNLRGRAHALLGARLLLTGPPGTGKSLAARAVATAARTDLLVVDVSRIVSKWLGETEKNLAAAFEAAERTQAVLMLDEADALFGSRTEISDAHDRYANLETAYLLARLDRFEGLVILTTNLRANIDPAFLRRIDYVVEFPLPDAANRGRLWRGHLPSQVLAADVDIDALAGLYPVPGAWIRNVTVAAAFAAAADGGVVTQGHLLAAMRREYAKVSLPFPGVPPRRRHDSAS